MRRIQVVLMLLAGATLLSDAVAQGGGIGGMDELSPGSFGRYDPSATSRLPYDPELNDRFPQRGRKKPFTIQRVPINFDDPALTGDPIRPSLSGGIGCLTCIPSDPAAGNSPSLNIPGGQSVASWRAKDATTDFSQSELHCSEAFKGIKSSDGKLLVRNTLDGPLTSAGQVYFSRCYERLDAISSSDPVAVWARERIVALHTEKPNDLCVATLLEPGLAMTARHCLPSGLESESLAAYTVTGLTNGSGSKWSQSGIEVVTNGASVPPIKGEPNGYGTRDYVTFRPTSGTWPIAFNHSSVTWNSTNSYVGVRMAAFTWIDEGDLASRVPNQNLVLMVDRSPSCVIGVQFPQKRYGLHRCQGIPGSSGGPLVAFTSHSSGAVTAMAFGIHVGGAQLVDTVLAGKPASAAIAISQASLAMSNEDRLGLLIQREGAERESLRLQRRLRIAKLP